MYRREVMDELLMASIQFEEHVINAFQHSYHTNCNRTKLARILCSVSTEHAESLRILMSSGNFTSGIGLLRLQYESIVRAIWAVYSASDTLVIKLLSDLSGMTSATNEKLPMLGEMLTKLEATAPENAVKPLLEFKTYSWKPLSSYVHGGKHAINRHSEGYPIELILKLLKHSNGLLFITGYFLSILSGDNAIAKTFYSKYKEFAHCLPKEHAL